MAIDSILHQHGLTAHTPPLADLSDESITAKLKAPAPVTSERNLWAFWDSGFEAMAPWKQRNVINWVRRCGHRWSVRLLDTVPGSRSHIRHFLPREALPDAVWDGLMDGEHSGQHTSELVRLALLYHHGGVFMDVSILLLRDLEDLCWTPLEDENSSYRLSAWYHINMEQVFHSSLAARKHDPFLYRWMQVFLQMWKGRRDAAGLHKHPLVRHLDLFQIKVFNIPADKDWEGFNDYTAILLAFQRVARNREPDGGLDGPAYVQQHVHLLSVSDEMETGFVLGEQLTRLLTLPVEADGEEGETARRYVYNTLGYSSVANYHQGIKYIGVANPVATQWNLAPSEGHDSLQGSWGEQLRYGSVHFQQTRTVEPVKMKEVEATALGLFQVAD